MGNKFSRYRRIIKKYIEYVSTKIRLLFEQKVFSSDKVSLKYIFRGEKNSNTMIVVFSSCTRRGLAARYNYMRTLSKVRANKLFILDDFASDKRGSYYLGENFTFNEEVAVFQLIDSMKNKHKIERIICCGSSKGGYSALNFGIRIPESVIVAGAPQYYLYDYLVASGNKECLDHIIGEHSKEKEVALNFRLRDKIREKENKDNIKIYMHYSTNDHTYSEHIKDMLCELNQNGYFVESDIAEYSNHSDISLYFPDYLTKVIGAVLSEQ